MSLAYEFDENDPREALFECSLSLSLLHGAFCGNRAPDLDDAAVAGLLVQLGAIRRVVDASHDVFTRLINAGEQRAADPIPAPRLTQRRSPASAAA